MVHANYFGILEKDKFQFTFGGNTKQPNVNNINNGFLIPQSGRIKKISIQDFGYTFYFDDPGDLVDELNLASRVLIPIFTIVLIKNNEVSDLTTYKCVFKIPDSMGEGIKQKCLITPDPKNIPISEGDILNIRTEINNMKNAPSKFIVRNPHKFNFNTDETKDYFFNLSFHLFDRVRSVVDDVLNNFFSI